MFLSRYLSALSPVPMWAPAFRSTGALMEEISELQPADRLSLLFDLYRVMEGTHAMAGNFDDFFSWGELLLSDFDDIDKNRANARQLFTNLSDLKQIDESFDDLGPEQVEAIKAFWKHFRAEGESPIKKDHAALWALLWDTYQRFRTKLLERNVGYEGMIYRQAAERIEQGTPPPFAYQQFVFIGFNAPNPCEEALMSYWQKQKKALFYWDYDVYYTDNDWHQAGYNLRRLIHQYPSALEAGHRHLEQTKDIEIIGIPSATGQARAASALLSEWAGETDWDRTVVVLPDEHLLLPLLSALPESIEAVNITMGYPFRLTPAFGLLQRLTDLQQNARSGSTGSRFFHKDIAGLLLHPYIGPVVSPEADTLLRNIREKNQIWVEGTLLHLTPILTQLFRPCPDTPSMASWLMDSVALLGRTWEEKMTEEESSPDALRQEYLFTAFTHMQRLRDVVLKEDISIGKKSYVRLLEQSCQNVTIPFKGEPLAGLQIMGVLETRTLDFDNLIILSMNEGVFPKIPTQQSFIPYHLRKGFGLPTSEHQDAISSYAFYRLIQRAQRIRLLYNSAPPDDQNGEISRFLSQLIYDPMFQPVQKSYTFSVYPREVLPVVKERSEASEKALNAYRVDRGGTRTFSPSALNTYLMCPLKFYYRYVEQLREPDELQEAIDPRFFGQLLHKSMELLYRPWGSSLVTEAMLRELGARKEFLLECIVKAFGEVYFKDPQLKPESITGRNVIIREVLLQYVRQILEVDQRAAPFEILGLEERTEATVSLPGYGQHCVVKMGGIIDRLERRNGALYIIDYKTGTVKRDLKELAELFAQKKHNGEALQALVYARLVQSLHPDSVVTPALYGMREVFEAEFEARLSVNKVALGDYREVADEFEGMMDEVLAELFLSEEPFRQTEDTKACEYCEFKGFCHR